MFEFYFNFRLPCFNSSIRKWKNQLLTDVLSKKDDISFKEWNYITLQNSRIFLRTRATQTMFEPKAWNECRNGEEEWGEKPLRACEVRALHTRESRLLRFAPNRVEKKLFYSNSILSIVLMRKKYCLQDELVLMIIYPQHPEDHTIQLLMYIL